MLRSIHCNLLETPFSFHKSYYLIIRTLTTRQRRTSAIKLKSSTDQNQTTQSHIITRPTRLDLDDLSPFARSVLQNNPSYGTRFGGKLSLNKKYLIQTHAESTGRAEELLKTSLDELNSTRNQEEKYLEKKFQDEEDERLPQPPVVELPSSLNGYRMNYGNENFSLPISSIPCYGCGALLQCRQRSLPGFIPYELFNKMSNKLKSQTLCQRCFLLKYHQDILECEVDESVYKQIIHEIKKKKALVILLVDLLDIPNSISEKWQELIDSNVLLFIIGNKVDLLPRGSENYLTDIERCLEHECSKRGFGKHYIKYYGVISAKTGYGVEELISKIFRYWSHHGGVYLLGSTNTGKSSLFNMLLDSDLCHIHALDCVQHATVSNLPGTTMNVLRFPIQIRTGKNQFMRSQRLLENEEYLIEKQEINQETNKMTIENETTIVDGVEPTVKWRRSFESEVNLPTGGASYDYNSGLSEFSETKSYESRQHNYANYQRKKMKAFDPKNYVNEKWLYDTPGVIINDQIINKCNPSELAYFTHHNILRPINIILKPKFTILIGGIARLDVLSITNLSKAYVSLMTNEHFPINSVQTCEVEQFYAHALEQNLLGVPQNEVNGKLQDPPVLDGPIVEILGVGLKRAAADIVLSSAGWASVTAPEDVYVTFRVYTPDGLGIHLRQPPLLNYLFELKGERESSQTPFYSKLIYSNDESMSIDSESYKHQNEGQMIINEKLLQHQLQINKKR